MSYVDYYWLYSKIAMQLLAYAGEVCYTDRVKAHALLVLAVKYEKRKMPKNWLQRKNRTQYYFDYVYPFDQKCMRCDFDKLMKEFFGRVKYER